MAQARAAQSQPLREYETIYVLRPDVAKESARKVSDRVSDVVSRNSGHLTHVETWGRRQLAYPVARFKRGVYVYVKYLGAGALVSQLERHLRLADEVLKFLTVQTKAGLEASSVEVDPESVQFEDIEPPAEGEEEEESFERSLGLAEREESRGEEKKATEKAEKAEQADEALEPEAAAASEESPQPAEAETTSKEGE